VFRLSEHYVQPIVTLKEDKPPRKNLRDHAELSPVFTKVSAMDGEEQSWNMSVSAKPSTGACSSKVWALSAWDCYSDRCWVGAFPNRFAAVASFHGGNWASEKPDGPHLFVKNITGRVYVAGAIEDASFPEEQKIRLEQTLTDAGVNHVVETYVGARHGFAVPDLPVFEKGAAERHWTALFNLFQETFAGA
jgi:Dienelactone hydrolase family